jgi:hypothetical protein
VGTFNFSEKYLSKKDSSTMLPELTEFVPATRMGIVRKAWAGQFSGIKYQTMHRFEQYLKISQLYHENSRFPPSFKFLSVSTIQKH